MFLCAPIADRLVLWPHRESAAELDSQCVGFSVGWLVSCWSVGDFVGWSVGRFVGCLIGRLVSRLADDLLV